MASTLASRARAIATATIIAVALALHATGASAQRKSLVIAVEDAAAPWSYKDGTGYANDVVVAAFKATGFDAELRVVPYARCKRMAMNGDVPACFTMSPAPEFKGLIEFSEKPLFSCYAGYFYSVDRPPKVRRQEALSARTVVGTVLGYEYPPEFEQLVQRSIVVTEQSPSEEINLKKLALGRIDLALLNYNELKTPSWLIGKAGVTGKVKTTFRSGRLNSYIGFSKKHPDGLLALREFNRGFRLISANGTLRHIKQGWTRKLAQQPH
jgi:polar amino acid transport system substrate-binding protein